MCQVLFLGIQQLADNKFLCPVPRVEKSHPLPAFLRPAGGKKFKRIFHDVKIT